MKEKSKIVCNYCELKELFLKSLSGWTWTNEHSCGIIIGYDDRGVTITVVKVKFIANTHDEGFVSVLDT